jgi:catechol 2,3-dioxygenase-like lactoylglutathione lyase family enzyme
MRQHLGLVTIVVRDYDEAIDFYVGKLGFRLVEDTLPQQHKRWVVVAPRGASETGVLLARAVGKRQLARIGDPTGGRVSLFLYTDDLARDHAAYRAKGVVFVREPTRALRPRGRIPRPVRQPVGSAATRRAARQRLKRSPFRPPAAASRTAPAAWPAPAGTARCPR